MSSKINYKKIMRILIIIALLIFITNQGLNYVFNLKTIVNDPCNICIEQQPQYKVCYEEQKKIITNMFYQPINVTGYNLELTTVNKS